MDPMTTASSALRAMTHAAGTVDEATVTTLRTASHKPVGALLTTRAMLHAAKPDSIATGWGASPSDLGELRAAERRGIELLNGADAIEHSHRKVNLAAVLDAAGVPHAAGGTPVRTSGELQAAVAALGGEARITGGFSHSRVPLDTNVALGIGGAPEPVVVRSPADLDAFAATQVDHARTYLVQPAPQGRVLHVATAGDQVAAGFGAADELAASERDIAVRAARATGLGAAGVDLVRSADGGLRVLDVHATPRGTAHELETLAASESFTTGIAGAASPSTAIADAVEAAKVQVGVLNMGRQPGKNISRTLAEIERQGGAPVFLPTGATRVLPDGTITVHGTHRPIDVALNRTGSIISDDALATLGDLERSGVPVLNGATPVSLVRDKNRQARTLVAAGVAHPTTAVVTGMQDVDRAIDLIGPSMVLKNPASSEGRGVMFLDGADVVRGVTNLFEQRAPTSRLVATRVDGTGGAVELADRASTEHAIRDLAGSTSVLDAQTGVSLLRMGTPLRLTDAATGASVEVGEPVSALTISDAFRDAKPGASLKAETWYREAAGADTRVHVARLDGEHRVLAAMERRVAPNEFGDARSNLSLGGGATRVDVSPEQEATALAAARAFGLDVAGVDLISTKSGPVVLEVNASPGLDIEKTTGAVADRWISEAMRRGTPHRAAR